ncbi:MAG: DMT family transporter [Fusobacterium gastrosuis]|uniref:DMT family transporter n=1 Tax=Fusobacterium gastrosuis TaxID=1755100 RepID=UPI0025EFB2D3|nr:DMT family transporter [uncultured Fusobacterium sp.]MDD7391868.1 DMT family transporter [Fusobacteriaceae bacterium]MDY5795035.1 DMT family transporter [Fusobacterium gastrosuis]
MNNKTKGILWMLVSVMGFTAMSLIIKYIPNIPIYEKLFFRNLINCMMSFIFIAKDKISLKVEKKYIPFVFGRSFFGSLGMAANFYAIEYLTIADANMLNKLSPVFVTICACYFLKEKIDKQQVIGIIFMLIAVVFVVKPGNSFTLIPSLVGLFGALTAGFSYTIIRYLNKKVESEIIIFYFSLTTVLGTLPYMMMNFVKPNTMELLFLVGIGLSATFGQFGLTYAYKLTPASEVSIYNYTIILTGMISGYLVFGEIPDKFSLIGAAIILTTAIYLYNHNKKKIINE